MTDDPLRPDRVRRRCPGGFIVRIINDGQVVAHDQLPASTEDPLAAVRLLVERHGDPDEFALYDGDTGRYIGSMNRGPAT